MARRALWDEGAENAEASRYLVHSQNLGAEAGPRGRVGGDEVGEERAGDSDGALWGPLGLWLSLSDFRSHWRVLSREVR